MDPTASAAPIAARGPSAWLWPVLLVVAGILAYANTFSVPLLLDDAASIAENPSIRRLWPLTEVLSPPANVGLGGRPISNLSFALNYAFGGTSVRGYHIVNLAIHLAAGLVLFGLVRRTLALPSAAPLAIASQRPLLAGFAALLWLLHPLQTESVTYLSQRTESLMALFYLLTVFAFARAALERRRAWAVVAVLACAFGMATKEVMVTAPVMVLLYNRTFISGSFAAAWRNHKRLHLALAATWLLLAFLLLDIRERGVGYITVSAWHYALTECRVVLQYLKLALAPHPLVFDYGTHIARSFGEVWPYAPALTALVVATFLALWRRPLLGFAGAWVLIALAPTSSIVPVAGQPMAEHRMYLPLAAFVTAVTVLAHRALGPRLFVPVASLLSLAATWGTFDRNRDYRTALALWTDTVIKAPDNARAHAALGAAQLETGNVVAAIPSLQRAVALDPQLAEAHNNLATALVDAGRPADAVPHFTAALQHRPGIATTHYNFGNTLLQLGRAPEAIAQQQQALVLRPQFPEASCALANALAVSGRVTDALPHYEAALRLRPDLTPAHYAFANALVSLRRFADALPHYEATLRAAPDNAEVHFNFGNALVQAGRARDAIPHYETVLRLQPDFAPARTNLEIVRQATTPAR